MIQENGNLITDNSTDDNRDVSIHQFADQGFQRLIELSETTYPGREISNSEYLGWEYIHNPDGVAAIFIGEKDGKIVSQYIVIPRWFSIDNNLFKGSLSLNTLTHHDHRGKKLFEKLAEKTFLHCIKTDIFFTIGFPNSVSHPVIERKEIFEIIGYLPLLFRPINIFTLLFKYLKGKKEKSGREIELVIDNEILLSHSELSLFDFSADSGKYENFINEFNSRRQNVTYRSLQFLRWRYVNIPLRKYYLLKMEDEGGIIAMAIFRAKYIYGMRCGILVDFISNSKKSENLITSINKISAFNKLDIIITTIPSPSDEFKILKKSGFFSTPAFFLPQKLAFIVRKQLSSCPEQVSDFDKWFITFGDYDIF